MAVTTLGVAIASLALTAASTAYTMTQKPPKPPTPQVPAAAAPGAREDTGANVSIGTSADDIKDQRVSAGSKRLSGRSSSGDVLGGLGRSGLSI